MAAAVMAADEDGGSSEGTGSEAGGSAIGGAGRGSSASGQQRERARGPRHGKGASCGRREQASSGGSNGGGGISDCAGARASALARGRRRGQRRGECGDVHAKRAADAGAGDPRRVFGATGSFKLG